MKLCTLLLLFCSVVLTLQNAVNEQQTSQSFRPRPRGTTAPRKTTNQPNFDSSPNFEPIQAQNDPTVQFSADLYHAVKGSQPKNFVLSPLSLRNALAMLSLGAGGEIAKEILQVLQFPTNQDLIDRQSLLISSLKEISSPNSGVKFVAADKIYTKFGLRVKTGFNRTVTQLGGEIEGVDFGKSQVAADKINEWVRVKTEGKIEKIVDSSGLNEQTSLLVLNTIYFKGLWKNQFPPKDTRQRPFFTRGKKNVTVDTMVQENEFAFAYLQDANAKVINLPYQGDRLSMMIYLPNEQSSLENLENWLKNKSAFEIQKEHLKESEIQSVTVFLPKFKIRSSLQLNEPLKSLGLSQMFDADKADFSNIFSRNINSFVSKVSQETFIEVNEEGTEAAAATGFEVSATSFGSEFKVNRPFLFQILDRKTETILFTGRVKNPLANSADSPDSEDEEPEISAHSSEDDEIVKKIVGNDARNPSCSEKESVDEILRKFLPSNSNSNSTLPKDVTIPVFCLTLLARKIAEKEKSVETIQQLQSKIKVLEKDQVQATPENSNHQGNFVPFKPAAWGFTNVIDLQGYRVQWEYNSTGDGNCRTFNQTTVAVYLLESCIALYRDAHCSGEKFQLDTKNSRFGQDAQISFAQNKSPKSIGVCS